MNDKPVINIRELSYAEHGDGGRFQAKLGGVGGAIGAQRLGYNITVLAPGKCAFPFHLHHANEEMFFILEGVGTLRYGEHEYPLEQGDFVACPAASGKAHQIRNTGTTDLKYLAVSTSQDPDVCEYPDSNKVACLSGSREHRKLSLIFKQSAAVDYFEDESER